MKRSAAANASKSKNEPREIGVSCQIADMTLNELSVYDYGLTRLIGRRKADFVEDPLENRMQPARTDVLNRRIDLRGNARQRRHTVFLKLELDPFRCQQCAILLDEAAFWLG